MPPCCSTSSPYAKLRARLRDGLTGIHVIRFGEFFFRKIILIIRLDIPGAEHGSTRDKKWFDETINGLPLLFSLIVENGVATVVCAMMTDGIPNVICRLPLSTTADRFNSNAYPQLALWARNMWSTSSTGN
jgi:hypothetical protein